MSEQYIAVPPILFNRVVEYLASKPFSEVHQLIDALKEEASPISLEKETESEETHDD